MRRGPLCVALTAGLGVLGALTLGVEPARAIPLPTVPSLPGLPGPGDLVRPMLKSLFDALFGDIPKEFTKATLNWLLKHPDFHGSGFRSLAAGADRIRELAYALSIGFFCAGVVRHLADDVTGAALIAMRRLVFAVIGITGWPWVFDLAVRFSNLTTEAFLQVPQVSRTAVALFAFAFLTGAATGIGFICGLLAAVLLIALLLEKLAVLTGLAVIYALTPALLAAYPFPPTSHLVGVAAAAFTSLLVLNPVWTALLAVFALVGQGVFIVGAGSIKSFTEPLLAISMLCLVVAALPVMLRMAWARGLAASLVTPTTGAGHGGASTLASLTTAARGASSVRHVLESRSDAHLRRGAWTLSETPMLPTGASPSLGALDVPEGTTVPALPPAPTGVGQPPLAQDGGREVLQTRSDRAPTGESAYTASSLPEPPVDPVPLARPPIDAQLRLPLNQPPDERS